MPKNKKDWVLFYPTADEKMADIWAYSSQWDEAHADRYTESLYKAINRQRDESLRRPFPRAKTADITDEQIYCFIWKYKSHTPAHTVFYRILLGDNIGVIDIIGPGQDKDNRLRDALEEVEPLIKQETDDG